MCRYILTFKKNYKKLSHNCLMPMIVASLVLSKQSVGPGSAIFCVCLASVVVIASSLGPSDLDSIIVS